MAKQFMVEVSARHAHVTKEDLAVLFGEGVGLTHRFDLSQPGQFATNERVTVVGPKGQIDNISILGPERSASQVEISATDCRHIGVPAVVQESGCHDGTPGCKMIGPAGEIDLRDGVIVAKRHIHMTPTDAAEQGVTDNQNVQVKINSPSRALIFDDVVIRVSENFALAMHIDTDEGNAALGGALGEIVANNK